MGLVVHGREIDGGDAVLGVVRDDPLKGAGERGAVGVFAMAALDPLPEHILTACCHCSKPRLDERIHSNLLALAP